MLIGRIATGQRHHSSKKEDNPRRRVGRLIGWPLDHHEHVGVGLLPDGPEAFRATAPDG